MAYTVNESVIKQAQKEYNEAKAKGDTVGMNNAHAKAEAERAKAGYSGGADGSQRIPTSSSKNTYASNSTSVKTPTTIWAEDGSAKTGYIQDGKTYYNDGTRIAEGSTVIDSSGVEWKMVNGQGVRTGNNYGISGNSYYGNAMEKETSAQNEYDALLAAYQEKQNAVLEQQQKALQSQIDASVNNLQAQKSTINSNYDDAARQAYITMMQNQRNLPEQLAAQGQNGGASETANLTVGATYQNNLANLNKSRNEALTGIDTEINKIKSSGSIEAAALAANSAQSALDTYLQLAQQKIVDQKQSQADAKNEFVNTIGAYSDDYMAEIQRIQKAMAAGNTSESWKIPYLTAARNEKIAAQQAALAEAEQREFENQLNAAKANAYIYNQYY